MYFGSLIGFLNNEFTILGVSYSKVFKNLKVDEIVPNEILRQVQEKLKDNINYHVQLLESAYV